MHACMCLCVCMRACMRAFVCVSVCVFVCACVFQCLRACVECAHASMPRVSCAHVKVNLHMCKVMLCAWL